jgi:predicted transcriptional regulator
MVVLLQLVASWWKVNEMPFPSMSTLAERAGISERQVQRAIKSLEQKGYVTKAKKKIKGVIASNVYDLSPLVKILQTVAEHFINKHPRNIHAPKDMKSESRVYVERRQGVIMRLENRRPNGRRQLHQRRREPLHWRASLILVLFPRLSGCGTPRRGNRINGEKRSLIPIATGCLIKSKP